MLTAYEKDRVEHRKNQKGFFSANILLVFLCYVFVSRFSIRSKGLLYKD